MDEIYVYVILAVFGTMFGSFAGATVWRLRARQLVEDKAEGEKVDKVEYKKLLPLTKSSVKTDRSRCLHCGHTLAWYDLLPLVSWLSLRGKCRYCHVKIGWYEPLMELGVATFFVLSYALWPSSLETTVAIFQFALWLTAGVLFAILFAYDFKWFLLPDLIVFPLIAVGALVAGTQLLISSAPVSTLIDIAGSVAILSGLYYVLHRISNGQWIGFGDVKLGLALGLILSDWKLAFIALFAANLIGCLIVIPGMLLGKLNRTTRVPFGPLLILGAVAAMIWGPSLIDMYFTFSV